MLTPNLWQEVGLCNGAPGIVHHFVYHEGHAPPNLPIAVLVPFPNYCGPPLLEKISPTTSPTTKICFNHTQEPRSNTT